MAEVPSGASRGPQRARPPPPPRTPRAPSSAAGLSELSVLQVHRGNLQDVWPLLVHTVRGSAFCAVDLEMTGIGQGRALAHPDIDERYAHLRRIAQTRAIVSLGVACFARTDGGDGAAPDGSSKAACYRASTFAFALLCAQPHTLEPGAARFLCDHGFDFNSQYATGIAYEPAGSAKDARACAKDGGASGGGSGGPAGGGHTMMDVFSLLCERPLVAHNGIIDLVFLYEAFHCALPPVLPTFLADLTELMPHGVHDTKHIAWVEAGKDDTRLAPLFYALQRDNLEAIAAGDVHAEVSLPAYTASVLLPCVRRVRLLESNRARKRQRKAAAERGRKKAKAGNSATSGTAGRVGDRSAGAAAAETGIGHGAGAGVVLPAHGAGLDAFMTGFCFAALKA